MSRIAKPAGSVVSVENPDAPGTVLLVCEHANNTIPQEYHALGLTEAQRQMHIAWDPGALGIARGLAKRLNATLVAANVSRLVYDCNRAPDAPGACAATSEDQTIPGNANLAAADRAARTLAVYLPFHAALHTETSRRMALGRPPVLVTIHTFTPVWFGKPRAVELGIIHDADPGLARRLLAQARAATDLRCELNAPYSAADDVTHTLRLQATPYGLQNVMLEVRNDLVTTPEAQDQMAATLAPLLQSALTDRHKEAVS